MEGLQQAWEGSERRGKASLHVNRSVEVLLSDVTHCGSCREVGVPEHLLPSSPSCPQPQALSLHKQLDQLLSAPAKPSAALPPAVLWSAGEREHLRLLLLCSSGRAPLTFPKAISHLISQEAGQARKGFYLSLVDGRCGAPRGTLGQSR